MTASWVPASERQGLHRIAPFAFVDQDGRTVSNETLRGKIHVANFFFTHCPSLCPKMTATFKKIQEAFRADPSVELLSYSVDAENDTPDRLAAYARENGVTSGRWHLLTGDQDAIYTLARTSYFAEKGLGLKKSTNEFLHTENMLLVDREGHIRGVYNATLASEAERVIEDIRALR
jgi:protein SCO1/2